MSCKVIDVSDPTDEVPSLVSAVAAAMAVPGYGQVSFLVAGEATTVVAPNEWVVPVQSVAKEIFGLRVFRPTQERFRVVAFSAVVHEADEVLDAVRAGQPLAYGPCASEVEGWQSDVPRGVSVWSWRFETTPVAAQELASAVDDFSATMGVPLSWPEMWSMDFEIEGAARRYGSAVSARVEKWAKGASHGK